MKKTLLPVLPLAVIMASSCQQNSTALNTLPPVVEKRPAAVSKPKKKSNRSTSTSKPASETTSTDLAANDLNPLQADPAQVTPFNDIPRFEVPENVQPKVSDGINQAEFIELKW